VLFCRIYRRKIMQANAHTPLQIGMLLYPGLTLLDLIGPQTVFSMHAQTHLVWKTIDTVVSDSGIGIQPTATFDQCPKDLDVLFVPGGFGTAAAMADAEILSFLANRAPRAKYVTSVCSGSLILGAAGLLKGYKATSHWALRDALSLFGAEPVEGRVVTDRNRITGGGVTAGIDFGLVMLAKMRGDDAARLTQLTMEYDPAPPFNVGSPAGAGPDLVKQALSFMGAADPGMAQLADGARNPT
jgi:cyclohexyl-isocyanide hydratase